MSNDTTQGGLEPRGDDPLVGQVIQDRYRVEKKLGQGGMGAVYLAEHILIQKKVAIKCLHAGLASNADVVRRFHNEAVAATAIGHPNIVDVTDMGRFDDGTFFMALEFLPGRDWQEDLDDSGAQSLEKVAHIGMQICDALDAAASKGIVHRDLKPENIFLIERHGDKNFVKVLDFGISKFHDGIGGSTRTGELMGTPYYMAPEQVRGERDISHVADIYALGVIFYQALTGEVPFDGNTLPELILKIAQDPAPPLTARLPEVPVPIAELVGRMLSKQAHHRPQKFTEVADVLANYVGDGSRMSRRPPPGQDAFIATAIGGSLDIIGSGAAVPDRPKQPTPVASRGPDTNAGGTPGLFGQTESQPPPAKPNGSDHSSTTSPHSITNSGAPALPTQKPTRSSKAPVIATAMAVLVGGGWFALGASQEPNTQPEAPTAPHDANTVRVQISTLPPDAELFLDGEPISNPFDGELEKDKKSHKLIAKREGFQDTTKKMVLSASQRVFIQLQQIQSKEEPPADSPTAQSPAAATRPKVRPHTSSKPALPAAPAPAPVPAPAPAPAPAPKPSDLKKIF